MQILYFLFFFPLIVLGSSSEEKITDEIVKGLKNKDFKTAELKISKLENTFLKQMFFSEINYQKSGAFQEEHLFDIAFKKFTGKNLIIVNYLYADNLKRKGIFNDSVNFLHYRKALTLAKDNKDSLLVNECLFRLCNALFSNGKNLNLFKSYINEYSKRAIDSVDKYWVAYFSTAYSLLSHLSEKKEINTIDYSNLKFESLFELAKESSYLTGISFQLKGIYYDVLTANYKAAEYQFRKAIEIFSKDTYFFSQERVFANKVNVGISLYKQKKIRKSIELLKKSLYQESYTYSLKNQEYIYKWLQDAYEEIKKSDSAFFCSKKRKEINDSITQFKHSVAIKKIDEQSKVKEKEKVITKLEITNSELYKNLYTIISILGFITLILILIFYLYKRYKKKSKLLENEQSQTLKKLEELEDIVIKNHIVLKDKTKVYISDLMYIKSDDHYLKIFTQDNKTHTVRGKLSKIKKELPPNFIQCQRSYIVNSNFIKQINSTSLTIINKEQIPLSRKYKKEF